MDFKNGRKHFPSAVEGRRARGIRHRSRVKLQYSETLVEVIFPDDSRQSATGDAHDCTCMSLVRKGL